MRRLTLTAAHVEAAVLGGAVLGGGGGGGIPDGLEMGRLAVNLGTVDLVSVDDLPPESIVATAALVGAPSSKDQHVRPIDFIRSMQLLQERTGVKVNGVITNENGAAGTVNGWLQAAALGVPVVDAPCNGRAHPTGLMGAMGLHQVTGYTSHQVAVGGNPATGHRIEVHATGTISRAAAVIRSASIEAGGTVAVARDPVVLSYVREHAAPGAIRQAIALGEAMAAARSFGHRAAVGTAAATLGGQVVDEGIVKTVRLERAAGYDVGTVDLQGRHGRYELTFWNEYMTLEAEGARVATFPDLIATLDPDAGTPLATAQMAEGLRVAILVVSRQRLILGAGMRDPQLFTDVERAIGKEVVGHVF